MEIFEKIAAYFSGNHSQRDELEIMEWRKNPENEKIYQELADLWNNSSRLDKGKVKVDVEQAWKVMEAKMKEAGNEKKILPLRYVWMAAAVLVPLMLGIWMMNYFNNETRVPEAKSMAKVTPAKKAPEIKMVEIITTDSVKQVYLPDSTLVSLNINSVFRYPEKFTGNERGVFLEGEAFFDVAENKDQPFIIRTETSITRVVGTSFNLKAYKDHEDVELVVESGTVVFAASDEGSEKLTLQANDKVTLNKKSKKAVKSKHTPSKIKWDASKLKLKIKKLSRKIKKKIK